MPLRAALLVIPAFLVCLLGASSALAAPKSFTLRPGPLSETHSFAVAELGVAMRMTGKKATPGDDAAAFVSDHGVLFNLSDRYAAGLVVHGEAGSHRSRFGPAVRVRRWLDQRSAVEIQAGALVLGGEGSGVDFRGPAPFVQASFSAGDVFVLHAQVQGHAVHLRGDYAHVGGLPPTGIDEDFNDPVTHVGVKLGTVPGRAGTVVVAIVAGLVLLAFSNFED